MLSFLLFHVLNHPPTGRPSIRPQLIPTHQLWRYPSEYPIWQWQYNTNCVIIPWRGRISPWAGHTHRTYRQQQRSIPLRQLSLFCQLWNLESEAFSFATLRSMPHGGLVACFPPNKFAIHPSVSFCVLFCHSVSAGLTWNLQSHFDPEPSSSSWTCASETMMMAPLRATFQREKAIFFCFQGVLKMSGKWRSLFSQIRYLFSGLDLVSLALETNNWHS